MAFKYVNQLTDEELKEIYLLFLDDGDKILCLKISRDDDKITLRGKIEISNLNAIPDETIIIDNDYYLEVKIYNNNHHHCEKFTSIYRKYMLEKFGTDYAVDYLINYWLTNWTKNEEE